MDNPFLQFVGLVVDGLTLVKAPYAISGGFASTIYGELRATFDVDMMVTLHQEQVLSLVAYFEGLEWYVYREGIERAIRTGDMFQVIDGPRGLKADFYPTHARPTPREQRVLQRARPMLYGDGDRTAMLMSPEDVILYKLQWYLQGESDKHIRDISGIVQARGHVLDYGYVDRWATEICASILWQQLKHDLGIS